MSGLEDGVSIPYAEIHVEPRASLVMPRGGLPGLQASIWMGGARSLHGEPLRAKSLATSVLVDCAGDLPRESRSAAADWRACVFADHDGPISAMWRIDEVVRGIASTATDPSRPISDIYVLCTHGMNRSGLVTGLTLRRLGLDGAATVERICAARPGALSNQAFRQLILNASF